MTRDRDDAGRPRNARPRDELGRPLPRDGSVPAVDPPALSPQQALAAGQQLLDAGSPFTAHEVFEAVWKATDAPDRALWRGLAQLAVGVTHAARGNDRGAAALLQRAADTLAPYAGRTPEGVAVDALRTWALAAYGAGAATPMPRLRAQAADDRA